jgi:hypothetical protein
MGSPNRSFLHAPRAPRLRAFPDNSSHLAPKLRCRPIQSGRIPGASLPCPARTPRLPGNLRLFPGKSAAFDGFRCLEGGRIGPRLCLRGVGAGHFLHLRRPDVLGRGNHRELPGIRGLDSPFPGGSRSARSEPPEPGEIGLPGPALAGLPLEQLSHLAQDQGVRSPRALVAHVPLVLGGIGREVRRRGRTAHLVVGHLRDDRQGLLPVGQRDLAVDEVAELVGVRIVRRGVVLRLFIVLVALPGAVPAVGRMLSACKARPARRSLPVFQIRGSSLAQSRRGRGRPNGSDEPYRGLR